MHPGHVKLVGDLLIGKLKSIRYWLSAKEPFERDAVAALSNPEIVGEIVQFTLGKLGHEPEAFNNRKINGKKHRAHKVSKRLNVRVRKALSLPPALPATAEQSEPQRAA